MKKRGNLRLLKRAFQIAGADKVLVGYLAFFSLTAVILWGVEPTISSISDSLWYCFAVSTTVGFGDITAVTFGGRIITVLLSLYSIGVVAILTAVITSFFLDVAKVRASESAKAFLDDLEHLPELSQEELRRLSEQAKKFSRERV